MPRIKSNLKAKNEVANRVTQVIGALQRLRLVGMNNAHSLEDTDIHKLKITIEREVQATVDQIQYQHDLDKNKVKRDEFKF